MNLEATLHWAENVLAVLRQPSPQVLEGEFDRPRFLWVHLFGPHDPYAAPPEFLGKYDPSDAHRTRFNSSPFKCLTRPAR